MATKPALPTPGETGPDPASPPITESVRRAVLASLGRPADLLQVTVRRVTQSGFRVNVITGSGPTAARIAHSYFVTTTEEGAVVGSAPALVRRY